MLKKIVVVGMVLVICFAVFSACSESLKWHEPPSVDFNNLSRIEVPKDVDTMEIEEDGKILEFKIIRTIEDLDDIRNDEEEDYRIRKNYILANNITFIVQGEQKYFRSIRPYFVGIFDGNNYRIQFLQFFNEVNSEPSSLFEYNGDNKGELGIIKNLIVYGTVFGSNFVGPIARTNYGIIENCINYATVSGGISRVFGLECAGIAATNAESGIIRNCIN